MASEIFLTATSVLHGMEAVVIASLSIGFFRYRRKYKRAFTLRSTHVYINDTGTTALTDKDALIAEKDLLLEELRHRTNNNLQLVMDLLGIAAKNTVGDNMSNVIIESRSKINAIALTYRKLQFHASGSVTCVQPYLTELVNDLKTGLGTVERQVEIFTSVDPVSLSQHDAVTLGLILTEAVMNSCKHAFDKKGGLISITLKNIDHEHITLTIQDNGKGLPITFNLKELPSGGIRLIRGLCKQIKGELSIKSERGLSLSFRFPFSNPAEKCFRQGII